MANRTTSREEAGMPDDERRGSEERSWDERARMCLIVQDFVRRYHPALKELADR